MAAAIRGGTQSTAKPRSKAPSAYASAAPRQRKSKPRAYAPAKLRGGQAVLAPQVALTATAVVLGLSLLIAATTGDRPQRIAGAMRGGMANNLAALGFKLDKVSIQGVDRTAQRDILQATGLFKGAPIFATDLEALRLKVQAVGWVKEARVVRLLPDTLVLVVSPRPTLAVWQHAGTAHVIDDQGKVIREADPGQFGALPLVVGAGADEAAGAILPVLRARPSLMDRTEALVRVDGRRWDLRLKDGSLIQLPAVGEDSALMRLDQLDQRARVLELGFERIDLRDAETIAVRPRGAAPGGASSLAAE